MSRFGRGFAVVAASLLLAACAHQRRGAIVPIRQLREKTDVYEGESVRTTGILRIFSSGTPDEHYAVEQDGQYRVGIHGDVAVRLRPFVNRAVEVEGELRFAEDFGIYIQVARLAPR
jgi:hypothetical protein